MQDGTVSERRWISMRDSKRTLLKNGSFMSKIERDYIDEEFKRKKCDKSESEEKIVYI